MRILVALTVLMWAAPALAAGTPESDELALNPEWRAPDQEAARERAKEMVRCSACHQESFRGSHPDRLGLKAAYHQQCIECHRNEAKGPVDCVGCHPKNVPDHKELVKLPATPQAWDVTAECLRCHPGDG